jgi:hypothetical protein
MNELLTVSEMKSRFPGEWVLVENPVTDTSHELLSGKVRYHSRDREDFDRKSLELRPRHTAVIYCGDILPAGMEAVL